MSPSQKRVMPVLAFAAALALAYFTWSAVSGPTPPKDPTADRTTPSGKNGGGKNPPVGPYVPPPPRNGDAPDDGANEKLAREKLEAFWTWEPKAAAEIVGLLRPDPLRKLAGIIEGGASPRARMWAIQLAAALSADANWDAAPNTPPPQPAPVTDPRLLAALSGVIRSGGEDPDVRRTAVAIVPLELDGRPNEAVLELFMGVLRTDVAGAAKAAVFDRFNNWFGTGEAAQLGYDRIGADVQAAALRTLGVAGDPGALQAAARVLRWGQPATVAPAVLSALDGEEDERSRSSLLSTAGAAAPHQVSEAWANGDLRPRSAGEEVQLSAIIGKAARDGSMTHFAIARQRLDERLATAPSAEMDGLLDAMAAMGSASEAHRRVVLEYFREQRARADLPEGAARSLDKLIATLDK